MEQEGRYPGTTPPTLETLNGEERRRQLAHFLKTRRGALTPASVGLPHTRRRRVQGLRREEVAEAAGISVAWYTWIEQARELKLSIDTLKRLSTALRLGEAERVHLYRLAGHPAPHASSAAHATVLPILSRIIDAMAPNPAYVLDPLWNVVAWNKDAGSLFSDFGQIPGRQPNIVRLTFLDERFRGLFLDWSQVACCVLGHFRSDSAEHVETTSWRELVEDLKTNSLEFNEWWPHHNVTSPFHLRKEIIHPQVGPRSYDSLDLELSRPGKFRIITYVPVVAP